MLLCWFSQMHPTPEEYWKVGLILFGIAGFLWATISAWMWVDERWVRRKDYDRDMQERDHRVLTETERVEKFDLLMEELIEALKKHKR
jgi:hypothetical protein